jgi:light-regulated signal transduction histidine kinase (bacteriophytochrome)
VASHDLQEPLRVVRSFLQLLKKRCDDKLDEESNQYIDYAVDGAERMKQLITDLLDYARLGIVPEKYEIIDTNLLLQRTAELLRESISASGTQLTVKNLPAVVGVKTQLGQVFQNLISNAIKYRRQEQPHIIIDGMEESANWKFSVSDNGIGIDPMFFDKIFVIFQRLNKETDSQGTGIGLAICKKIVEGHGGRIWVESLQGSGSTFYFTIQKPQ